MDVNDSLNGKLLKDEIKHRFVLRTGRKRTANFNIY